MSNIKKIFKPKTNVQVIIIKTKEFFKEDFFGNVFVLFAILTLTPYILSSLFTFVVYCLNMLIVFPIMGLAIGFSDAYNDFIEDVRNEWKRSTKIFR